MNKLFTAIITIGFIIVIGVAGSTDINAITFAETLAYTTIGMTIIFTGLIGLKGRQK